MQNNSTTIRPTTLLAISQQYGIAKKTLIAMIELTPGLKDELQPYTNGPDGKRMRVLPVSVVRKIYDTLGYPDE